MIVASIFPENSYQALPMVTTELNLQGLGHDEEGEGEAEADDEDAGHHQLSQQPGVQGHSRLEIFL